MFMHLSYYFGMKLKVVCFIFEQLFQMCLDPFAF